jgi:hypothetical protein
LLRTTPTLPSPKVVEAVMMEKEKVFFKGGGCARQRAMDGMVL